MIPNEVIWTHRARGLMAILMFFIDLISGACLGVFLTAIVAANERSKDDNSR